MCRRFFRFVFLFLVFLSGVIVGGVNTPKIIAYAFNDGVEAMEKQIQNQTVPQKPRHQKKPRLLIRSLV